MPLTSFSEVSPLVAAQLWLPPDGGVTKVLVAAQPTIWRLDTIIAVNDDTVAHIFSLALVDPSAGLHGIGQVSIPASAGHSPNPAFDILNALFPSTQVGIALPAGWIMQAAVLGTITNAVGVVGYGGYF